MLPEEHVRAHVSYPLISLCRHLSPAYAGSHGCEAVEECQRVSSEALAKEDMLRRVPPKTQK
mgnify:FL=1